MVAPAYEKFRRISPKPFIKNGKEYITVEHPTTKNHRDVRWYSDAEFAKAYGRKILGDKLKDGFDGLKHARGFDNGPILVIRNVRPSDEAWLGASCARYAVGIGWHFVSTDTFPEDAPEHFRYLLLGWDEFRDGDDRHMKKPEQIAAILTKKACDGKYINMKASTPTKKEN